MTIEDIRRLEREAQEKLRQKYHKSNTVTISPGGTNNQSPVNEDDPPPNYEDIEIVNQNHTELQLPSGKVFIIFYFYHIYESVLYENKLLNPIMDYLIQEDL